MLVRNILVVVVQVLVAVVTAQDAQVHLENQDQLARPLRVAIIGEPLRGVVGSKANSHRRRSCRLISNVSPAQIR